MSGLEGLTTEQLLARLPVLFGYLRVTGQQETKAEIQRRLDELDYWKGRAANAEAGEKRAVERLEKCEAAIREFMSCQTGGYFSEEWYGPLIERARAALEGR